MVDDTRPFWVVIDGVKHGPFPVMMARILATDFHRRAKKQKRKPEVSLVNAETGAEFDWWVDLVPISRVRRRRIQRS